MYFSKLLLMPLAVIKHGEKEASYSALVWHNQVQAVRVSRTLQVFKLRITFKA
jgi:hypothetical protein